MGHEQQKHATILLIHEDVLFAERVADTLRSADYVVEVIENGHKALLRVLQAPPDLVLLDVSLPDINGMDLCHLFRQHAGSVPIIFLTTHHAPREIISGLDAGADDYVVRPCNLEVLLARIRVVLRRAHEMAATAREQIIIGDVAIDAACHHVHIRGKKVDFSPKEFNLLWLLMSNAGRVMPRMQIIDAVWGVDFYGDVKALDVYIRLLRRKVECDPEHPRLIQTVRGVGYLFAPPEEAVRAEWSRIAEAAS